MYNCEMCGYFSNDMKINSCQNHDCVNYGKHKNYYRTKFPNDMSELAFAVVPFQKLNTVFKTSEVLKTGTIFPELYMPYTYKILDRS